MEERLLSSSMLRCSQTQRWTNLPRSLSAFAISLRYEHDSMKKHNGNFDIAGIL